MAPLLSDPLDDPHSDHTGLLQAQPQAPRRSIWSAGGAKYASLALLASRDIKKRRRSFCIGLTSCVLVVFILALCGTALDKVPLIFLRLGELGSGESDILIRSNLPFAQSINYTAASAILRPFPDLTFSSPRHHWPSIDVFNGALCTHQGQPLELHQPPYPSPDGASTAWMYMGVDGAGCGGDCLPTLCAAPAQSSLLLIDSAREATMQLGREWPYPAIAEGRVLVSWSLASSLGLSLNSTLILSFDPTASIIGTLREAGLLTANDTKSSAQEKHLLKVHVPFVVAGVFNSTHGKTAQEDPIQKLLILEYAPFLSHVSRYFHPSLYEGQHLSDMLRLGSLPLHSYAQEIHFNFPPAKRFDIYSATDFEDVQSTTVQLGTQIKHILGFNQVLSQAQLLPFLQTVEFVALFIGLTISLIIMILTALSIALIYSLLMMNVETKTFEMAILRTQGLSRPGVAQYIFIQSLWYALPAVLIGLLLAQLGFLPIETLIASQLGAHVGKALTLGSVLQAAVLGITIPILSSLLPIRKALGYNLADGLDVARGGVQAISYAIERSSTGLSDLPFSQIIIGLSLAAAGFGTYYMFPLSLLTMNVSLLLYMFFALLLGIFAGLAVLSLNLQRMVEYVWVYLLLFWENTALRSLLLKNLLAHKLRNQKTVLMFAFSLGFIIFVSATFTLNIESLKYELKQRYGSRLVVAGNIATDEDREFLVSALLSTNLVEDVTFSYPSSSVTLQNPGRYKTASVAITPALPNFFAATDPTFLSVDSAHTQGWDLLESLYTVEGSSRLVLGTAYKKGLGITSWDSLVLQGRQSMKRPLAFLNKAPVVLFSQFPFFRRQNSLCSLPSYLSYTTPGTSVLDITPSFAHLKLVSGITKAQVKNLKSYVLTLAVTGKLYLVKDVDEDLKNLDIAVQTLDFFLIFTTVMGMVICSFGLISNMYTNIQEQTREIGMIRALGVKYPFILRLYIYESFILVLTAASLGLVIGMSVAYAVVYQRSLITQIFVPVPFPTVIVIAVVLTGIVLSIVASFGPIRAIDRKPITAALRHVMM